MSQEKVDRYKEYKKNRKENLEKEKKAARRTALIWRIVVGVLALALVAAIGITVYNVVSKRIQARPDYDRDSMIVADIAGIYETTEETTEAPAEESSEDGTTEADSTQQAETTAAN